MADRSPWQDWCCCPMPNAFSSMRKPITGNTVADLDEDIRASLSDIGTPGGQVIIGIMANFEYLTLVHSAAY